MKKKLGLTSLRHISQLVKQLSVNNKPKDKSLPNRSDMPIVHVTEQTYANGDKFAIVELDLYRPEDRTAFQDFIKELPLKYGKI